MREPAVPIERLVSPADIARLAEEARAAGRIGLDTEFLWERTYAPVPCLAQVATATRLAIIDPIEGADLAPIAALVADPAVEVIMHAPAADLVLFARRFGVRPTRIFDVQLVAGFVGLGTSLAYERLVERALHVRLVHNETFSNWVKRPLSDTQIAYAADDVRHLHALADTLTRELAERGRTAHGRRTSWRVATAPRPPPPIRGRRISSSPAAAAYPDASSPSSARSPRGARSKPRRAISRSAGS